MGSGGGKGTMSGGKGTMSGGKGLMKVILRCILLKLTALLLPSLPNLSHPSRTPTAIQVCEEFPTTLDLMFVADSDEDSDPE